MIATRSWSIVRSCLWAMALTLGNASIAGAAPITFGCIAGVGAILPVCTTTREFDVWFGTLTATAPPPECELPTAERRHHRRLPDTNPK